MTQAAASPPPSAAPNAHADARGRPAGAALLAARSIGIHRSGRWLIRNVDMAVRPGEVVTLLGPNGSGKSTTVKALLGLLPVDEGSVVRRDGLRIGYAPQSISIDETLPLSVGRMMTLTGRVTPLAIRQALEETGVAHLEHAAVQTLSGGEFRRVMLARAIARDPDVLVLDEPVQSVDFYGQIALYELISAIRDRRGCAVLLISHDLHIVMARTDTVVCLNGHVCCQGSPQSVAGSAAFQQLFGPQAAETLAIYRHHHDHRHGEDGSVRAMATKPGEPHDAE